jgi:hypothetical protein
MEPTDITVEIMKSIRDEAKQTNGRLEEMREELSTRIEETNSRLLEMREELSTRIVHSEIRTATAITELAGTVREMTAVVRTSLELRPRVERCEDDIRDLQNRLDRVTPR